jgi:hypothetical protein
MLSVGYLSASIFFLTQENQSLSETYNAALRNHGLHALGRQRLLKEADQVELDRVEEDIAGDEQLVWLAETELLKRAHELLVLLRAFAHCEAWWPLGRIMDVTSGKKVSVAEWPD